MTVQREFDESSDLEIWKAVLRKYKHGLIVATSVVALGIWGMERLLRYTFLPVSFIRFVDIILIVGIPFLAMEIVDR